MHSFFSLIVFYFEYIPFFHRSWRIFWIPLLKFLLNKYFVELQTTLPAFYIWSGVFVYMCVVVCVCGVCMCAVMYVECVCVWSVYVCGYVCGVHIYSPLQFQRLCHSSFNEKVILETCLSFFTCRNQEMNYIVNKEQSYTYMYSVETTIFGSNCLKALYKVYLFEFYYIMNIQKRVNVLGLVFPHIIFMVLLSIKILRMVVHVTYKIDFFVGSVNAIL